MQDKSKIKVEEFTSPNLITASVDETFRGLLRLMKDNDIRHVPILDDNGKVVGMVSQRDLKVVYATSRREDFIAKDLMSPEPYMVPYDMSIDRVALEMSKRKIGSAVVLDEDDQVYGIFTSTDALNALIEIMRGEV